MDPGRIPRRRREDRSQSRARRPSPRGRADRPPSARAADLDFGDPAGLRLRTGADLRAQPDQLRLRPAVPRSDRRDGGAPLGEAGSGDRLGGRRGRHARHPALALPPLHADPVRRRGHPADGRHRFIAAEFFGGVSWAVILVLAAYEAPGATGIEIFQFATMLIVVSVVTALASTVPAAAVAGSVPVTLTLVALYRQSQRLSSSWPCR